LPEPLPRLRPVLDAMPSPWPEHPGLFLRDPYHYSDAMLVIPPLLAECLGCFDGKHNELDLRALLVRLTNSLEVGEIVRQLVDTLSGAGFLEDGAFAVMRDQRRREFAENPLREPAHAGSAYPAEPGPLRETMANYMQPDPGDQWGGPPGLPSSDGLFGIAAPHVSPDGGWRAYRAAYSMLRPEHRDRTFVILATSHYGQPETFGLTRKSFVTPLGQTASDVSLVDWLAARGGDAVIMEDYCHSFEHTVEFQVVFLQHVLGPDVRILPILCGGFAHSILGGGQPEDDSRVGRFLDALGELREREGDRLFWILGVDMAHMGARYGDDFQAAANEGLMTEVAVRDQARMDRIAAADARGFWDLVRPDGDPLKWCGSAPFYTFLKAAPQSKGELLQYEQWNIDAQSVVSFAGMAFRKG
jgi:AmmeMemoRadiSam system protein B